MAATLRASALLAAALLSAPALAQDCSHPLLDPTHCGVEKAPDAFNVTWTISVPAGKHTNITVRVERKSAPLGVDRFYNLARLHYFDGTTETGNACGFFRVVAGFVTQFGISGAPPVSKAWQNLEIKDDPVLLSNVRGTIAFATAGANTRTTQVYFNLGDNSGLDGQGFAPFGTLSVEDMKVVDAINAQYAQEPDQDAIYAQGDAYLKKNFPKLDYIEATFVTV
jgi:peptidyl-prolyl cis-trans isomerase A (cyclophilin A)